MFFTLIIYFYVLYIGDNVEEAVLETLIEDSSDPVTKRIDYRLFCEKLVVPPCFDIADNRRKIRLEISRESSRNA